MNNIFTWGLIITGLLIIIISIISEMQKDITRINVTLNKIAPQVVVPNTVTDELKSLLLEGKRIKAIKKYREVTGVGLLEAKKYVDLLNEQELK